MISRYQRNVFNDLWSDTHKFDTYLKVELAASYAFMKQGLFDLDTYEKISKASFTLKDIEDFELETKHDIIAFIKATSKSLGEEKKWFHYGLTSTDLVDTAYSVILKEVNQIILDDIDQFMDVLKQKAMKYQYTEIMGRTHGMHAEVTSFGLKFALWYEDFKRIRKIFIHASDEISVIKMSGAVGNFSSSHPDIQKVAAKYLGLKESNITTQTLQRDRHAAYMSSLALIASELEKIAVEIRHLSRTEVKEVSEYFSQNQKGSSAMPHKKNPISSENISGLSRVVRGYLTTAFENIALWHERDISHSSAERIILSDATSLVDYMLNRYKDTIISLEVNQEQMKKNINLTHGIIYAQGVMNYFVEKGLDRLFVYDLIQELANQSLKERKAFKELICQNDIFISKMDSNFDHIFEPATYLKHTNHIYRRVFET
jgi:adenylosuccinate lyase